MIEHWGSGIPRIIGKVKAAGLREPEFIGGEVDLRINIYRGQIDDASGDNKTDKVPDNGYITTSMVAELLEVKQRRARAILQDMVEGNYLRKEGAARRTIYVNNMEGR